MTYWAEYAGVYFIEGSAAGAVVIGKIDAKHDGGLSQSQLKSLDNTKVIMSHKVKAAGGNAVIDFQYGQRSTFWRSLLSIDDVYWFATGSIAKIARPPS